VLPINVFSDLSKLNREDTKKRVKELEEYTFRTNNIVLAYRLAVELDDLNLSTRNIERFIIKTNNPKFIWRFAKDISSANIKKLQDAIIATNDISYITKFGLFVKGANKSLIENIVIQKFHPKSAYLYIKYHSRYCKINKLKHIIFKSKRPRYLYTLAKLLKNKKDIKTIQTLLLASRSSMYLRLFALNIKYVDISKLEDRVINLQNIEEMKKFARDIKSEKIMKLSILF
jgi:hypothetical protein